MTTEDYSVPAEAKKVFEQGIVNNPCHKSLHDELKSVAHLVKYKGNDFPKVPINWRFCESISALKGLEASMINIFNQKKYGAQPLPVLIDTDHANLFYMSVLLWTIDLRERQLNAICILDSVECQKLFNLFPDQSFHNNDGPVYQAACTNIYKTKDGRFFHLHGVLNNEPMQKMLGLPLSDTTSDRLVCNKIYANAVAKFSSEEIQKQVSDVYGQTGTICWSIEEYKSSEHGKANAHVGLWETHHIPSTTQTPSWWMPTQKTSAQRPLAGLKVIDLSRIIAGPSLSRTLAGYGASVMRLVSPNIDDMTSLVPDLGWGKWNAFLDLKTHEGKKALRELITEVDVILIAYRPSVLTKYGFSNQDIMDMVKDRATGIIIAQVNCYGWNGPWSCHAGCQQISDANCGISLEFGRAMGHNEPVTPAYPNSDYCAGVAGVCGVFDALMQRSEKGGSYVVDIALNYYSQWLINAVGVYPDAVWQELWAQHGKMVFHSEDNMRTTIPAFMRSLHQNHTDLFTNSTYYTIKHNKVLNEDFRIVKDCIQWPSDSIDSDYHIGAHANGTDKPRWPKDLSVEIVTAIN